jgi:cell division protein FtsI/penicillin-binding protein 2
VLLGRLYLVQVVRGDAYQRDAMGQYVEASAESSDRGSIFFTTKDGVLVAAAVMQRGWRIAINPQIIDDPDALFEALSAVVPIDSERFFASAAKRDDPYEEVAFRLPDDAARVIREKKLPGVLLVQDQWRSYPAGSRAAQTLGFVGYVGDTRKGVYGLEREWQDTLSLSSRGLYVNPFAEIFTNVGALFTADPADTEGSIITSIEPTVQQKIEETLEGVMRRYSPDLAGGIIMDPETGEIAAIAVQPTFDPNTYNLVSDPAVYGNPLVEGRYEMGSIMKPLTVAAGIDAKAISRDTHYEDTGCVSRSGKKVCNYDFKARGWVDMQQVLNQSLNTGVTFIADTMGHPAFTLYMRSYGLGSKTGIDVSGEISGDISALGNGTGPEVDYAAASFGQGIAVTPIEMIRALSALANEGVLPQPHLVTGIRYESGLVRKTHATSGPQVLQPETAAIVSTMLTEVFDDALLGGALKQDHYSIAAKTGTAQIAIPGGGGYYPDRYLHSFFGYFPSHDPEFIIFLFAVEPEFAEFASATLAQPFLDMAEFLINYYDIPPDR